MSWSLSFAELVPAWLLLGLAALLLCTGTSIYFARQRLQKKPKRLVLVVVLNVLASIALVGLIADIKFSKPEVSQAWLFSQGSLPLSAENQALLDTKPEAKLFALDKVADLAEHKLNTAKVLSDPIQILDWSPQLQQLTVVGDGLNSVQWQTLKANNPQLHIDFIPSKPLTGLVNMTWNKQLLQGENLKISGQLQVAEQDANPADLYELSLLDPMGNTLTKQNLRAGENFAFNALPPTTGNWLYQLSLAGKDSGKTALITEKVAVAVHPANAVKLLIYQSAPSFETRQLRAWAGSFNNPVTVLSQISKDKHLSQHFNYAQPPADMQQLTSENLKDFDLVIMDGRALSVIDQTQWLALKQAVQQGLGLLLLADQSLQAGLAQLDQTLASKIALSVIAEQGVAQTVVPHWPHSQIEQAIQAQPWQLSIQEGKNLVSGEQQQALVSMLPMGLGRIGISLLNNSYQWQTAGMPSQYSAYWQYLLANLATKQHSAYWLTPSSEKLLLVQQQSNACVLSQTNNIQAELQSTNSAGLRLNFTADTLQQERYCISYWPQHLGWQQLSLLNKDDNGQNSGEISAEQNSFVYSKNDWQAWQQQQKQQSSAYQARLSQSLAKPLPTQQYHTLNKLWCWLLWLSCCSLLWVERKLFSAD